MIYVQMHIDETIHTMFHTTNHMMPGFFIRCHVQLKCSIYREFSCFLHRKAIFQITILFYVFVFSILITTFHYRHKKLRNFSLKNSCRAMSIFVTESYRIPQSF